MYLSKVEIDRKSQTAREMLSNRQQMHRFVTEMFCKDLATPFVEQTRQTSKALYRTFISGNKLNIYIYSHNTIEKAPFCNVQTRDLSGWLNRMKEGQVWNFDIIASPCKKVQVEGKKNCSRRSLRLPEERQNWLERKAAQFGFEIIDYTECEHVNVVAKHEDERIGETKLYGFHYQGVLRITDADAFRNALEFGIGPGKAYGFGMMMVKQ